MHHPRRFAASLAPLLSLTAITAGCVAVAEPDADVACDGKCDDASASAPVASCWIVPGEGTDPFFISDSLVCTRGDHPVYDLVVVNAHAAGGSSGGERLDPASTGPTTILRLPRDTGYPVRLQVELLVANPAVNNVLPLRLIQAVDLAGPEAATAAAPQAWRVPFRLGDVTIDSHLDGGELQVDYALDLAPYVDGDGLSSARVRKAAQLIAGRRIHMALPWRGGPIDARVGERATPLPGLGHFALTADGIGPVAEPTGAELVRCEAGDAGEADGAARPVRCTLTAPAELRLDAATAVVSGVGGEVATPLDAGVATAVGASAGAGAPLTVTVRATLRAAGARVLDPAVDGKTIELAVTVPADGTPAIGRLGLALWSTTLTCGEELCMIDRPGFLLPLPTPGQWATRVGDSNPVNLGRGDQTTFVFATPAGTPSFTGTAAVLVGSDFVEKSVEVGPGTFVFDRTGLTPGA